MKFFLVLAALCIGAAFAEVSQEQQLLHEQELAELCKERGVFPNPHDETGSTFIRCELEPIELRCDEGFIFDAEKLMCVEVPKPAPEPVDMDKVNWNEVLECPDVEDKYFRNPYDCHRFYRCYKQGHFNRLDVGTCVVGMIFDEVLETCLPEEQFRSYYGHSCEAKALPVPEEKDPKIPTPEEKDPDVPAPEEKDPDVPAPEEKDPDVPAPEEKDPDVPAPEEKDPDVPAPEEKDPDVPAPEEKDPDVPAPEEKDPDVPAPEEKDPDVPAPEEKDPDVPAPEEKDPDVPAPEEKDPNVPAPEQEKVPSLEDILKQIKDIFGRKN